MRIKGMWTDGKPNQQPEDTTRINKNIVDTVKFGTQTNELGFELLQQLSYYPIGVIRLDTNDFVVFSTDDINSEIGIFHNGIYEIRTRDTNGLLNFKKACPIHGVFYLNNQQQRIIEWTDSYNVLRSLNIDITNGLNSSPAQMNAFNYYKVPVVDSRVINAGNLQSGAYIPFLAYVHSDGSVTDYIKKYNPIYISNSLDDVYTQSNGSESGIVTNKAIALYLSNLDYKYAKIRIGIIYSNKGTIKTYRIKDIDIGQPVFLITGEESFIEVPIDDIIINKANYRTVDHLASFEDRVYGWGVVLNVEPDLSTLLNSISATWYSEKVQIIDGIGTSFTSNQNYKLVNYNNKKKSFAHDEVYAFYIRIKWSWGYGRWNNFQGRLLTDSEQELDFAPLEGTVHDSFRKYEINDTCTVTSKNATIARGTFSAWQNTNDTRRHFKFPSLNWMRNNVWDSSDYGTKYLDALGIEFHNIDISTLYDFNGQVAEGYEIGYAKRNSSRVVSQSIWVPSVNRLAQIPAVISNPNDLNVLLDGMISTGGNWNNQASHSGFSSYTGTTAFRLYPFDLLRDKLSRLTNFVRTEYKLTSQSYTTKYDEGTNTITVAISDFVETGASFKVANRLSKINESRFIPSNVITSDYNNTYLEEFYSVKFDSQPTQTTGSIVDITNIPSKQSFVETTALLTLLNIQHDYYIDYINQQIVNCDAPQGTIYFGGDVFLCDSSVNTFGVDFTKYTSDLTTYNDNQNQFNYKSNGIRTAKRYLFESQYNVNLRYINPKFELATSYYPKAPFSISMPTSNYLKTITKDVNPNDFVNGYEVDMHMSNSYEFTDIFNPIKPYVTKYPFRVVVSEKLNYELELDVNAWKDFKQNNYYELDRKRGRPRNLIARGDKMYFHFQNSLYQSKPRSILQALDGVPIQLGYGNIFEFDPIPVLHSELGEMGTNHKWSCVNSKVGYIFFDSDKGVWFIVSDGVDAISNKGMYNFFKTNKECFGDNPFNGVGIIAEYDEFYNRLIITKKNKKLPPSLESKYVGVWKSDDAFLSSLKSGDIVLKDGRYKQIR